VTSPSGATGQPNALAVERLVRELRGPDGQRRIVDEVSFEVGAGELFVLVGPSGCGKSTLLRTIAGLDPAAAGTVRLNGRDVTHLPPERRHIGLVFQDHALFPHLRVAQNVGFGLRHLPRRARAERVSEVLELVRLGHTARRFPHQLSGGEQQRIALARALAPSPAVVLLDEPFASIDASLRGALRDDVVQALRAQGAAAVLVTHDRDDALGIGGRVGVMRDGRLCQIGAAEDVYEQPVDRFVASFLGSVGFLDDGRMVRPHDLALVAGGPWTVVDRRYLGGSWRYLVRDDHGNELEVDGEVHLTPGDCCDVTVVATHELHRLPG
jgi:iron(III) transport system ATP-binding protein